MLSNWSKAVNSLASANLAGDDCLVPNKFSVDKFCKDFNG